MGREFERDELRAASDIVRDSAKRTEDAVADLVERGQPAAAAAGDAFEEVLGRLDSLLPDLGGSGSPSPAHWVGPEDLGGVLTSGPGAAAWSSGRLDVFARGQNDALWHWWYDGAWRGPEDLGGVLTSGPGAAAWSSGRLDVFARGQNDALWHWWYDES